MREGRVSVTVQVHRIEGGAVTILLGRRTAGVGLDGTLEEPAPADDDVVTNGGMWRSSLARAASKPPGAWSARLSSVTTTDVSAPSLSGLVTHLC